MADLPDTIARVTAGYSWERNTIGESGCVIWRLTSAAGPAIYVKKAAGRHVSDLIDEFVRLDWFSGRLPVPEVRAFVRATDDAWLVTTALRGQMAETILNEHPERRMGTARALAAFLKRIHALPAATCPFNARLPLRLAAARRNIDDGLVPEDEFDPDRRGWSAEQVWTELHRILPRSREEVVTHGDFSLGNLLIEDGEVTGCIDVGRAGVADPYQDLAILWNCLRDYGPGLVEELWRAYGIRAPDEVRLRAHLLLDELF